MITRWSELGSLKKVGDADADSALTKIRDFEKQNKKKGIRIWGMEIE